MTAGAPRTAMRPVRLVAPPESTTPVRSKARRSRESAWARSRPQDVTVATTGSSTASTTSPTRRAASTRTPVPTGRVRTSTRPPVGAYPRSGSWASRRASTVQPSPAGGVGGSVSPRSARRRMPRMPAPVRSSTPEWVTRPSVSTDVTAKEPSRSSAKWTTALPRYAACSRSARAAASIAAAVSSCTPVAGSSVRMAQLSRRTVTSRRPSVHTVPTVSRTESTSSRRAPSGNAPVARAGTPAADATAAKAVGVPNARMAAASGPRTRMPSPAHSSASTARSAQGTIPSQTASARAATRAATRSGASTTPPGRYLDDQRLARLAGPPGPGPRYGAHRDGAQPLPGDGVGDAPSR